VIYVATVRGSLAALTLMAFGALNALSAAPAEAAYPGENGKIYFQSCGELCSHYDVYAVNPDGSGLENVTGELTGAPGLPDNAFEPSVSADGKRLVFGVDSQATAEIWMMNTDGSSPLQLTKDNLLDQQPSISPDGTRVAWNQWSPFPEYTDRDIWVMNSDGSGQQLLFNGFQEDYFPRFTPDGQTVVMASETGDIDIRKIPSIPAVPPLTEATGLAEDNELLESHPSVSPDGSRVAFTQTAKTSPSGPFDIYSVSINGGATTPVYNSAASETSPAYSPDGTKMVFDLDGVPTVGNADGGGTLTPLNVSALFFASNFDWAPRPVVSQPPPAGATSGDLVPPQTTIDKAPKRKSKSHKAIFRFSSNEPGSTFRCKLDKGKFAPCTSPKKYTKLRVGKHTFRVFAIDPAGNPDASPATRSFRIQRVARRHHSRVRVGATSGSS